MGKYLWVQRMRLRWLFPSKHLKEKTKHAALTRRTQGEPLLKECCSRIHHFQGRFLPAFMGFHLFPSSHLCVNLHRMETAACAQHRASARCGQGTGTTEKLRAVELSQQQVQVKQTASVQPAPQHCQPVPLSLRLGCSQPAETGGHGHRAMKFYIRNEASTSAKYMRGGTASGEKTRGKKAVKVDACTNQLPCLLRGGNWDLLRDRS